LREGCHCDLVLFKKHEKSFDCGFVRIGCFGRLNRFFWGYSAGLRRLPGLARTPTLTLAIVGSSADCRNPATSDIGRNRTGD